MPEPWLRLPPKRGKAGETEGPEAYAAFQAYYLASPDQRTLRQAALKVGKRVNLLERWSSRFFWIKRAEIGDRHQDRIAADAREQRQQKDGAKWDSRENEVYENEFKVGRIMVMQGVQIVRLPVTAESSRSYMAAVALIKAGNQLSLSCIKGARPAPKGGPTVDDFEFVLLTEPKKKGGGE